MKPIKPCVVQEILSSVIFMVPVIMPTALSTISINPAELKDLLRSCGADDVHYYACGALNDSNKTCGALRFIKGLQS
jgi:hypothetical protein